MSESRLVVLPIPLPGQRIVEGQDPEDGSIIAYRKDGDEGLFASWFVDEDEEKPGRPMVWIPVGEFSPDPEAIRPPEIEEEGGGEGSGEPATERAVEAGPFGRPRGRSKRPEA